MDYHIQRLDHLGIVAGMCDRIKLVEQIDSFFPNQERKITIGEATKAMILNALGFSSRAMYLSSEFFSTKPVQLLFRPDLVPADFNDDTLGRALDALFDKNVTTIFAQVASSALVSFEIEHIFFHLDTSSFSFYGKYLSGKGEDKAQESDEPVAINICRGFSKDKKPGLNQAVLSLICAHKSTLPVWLEALDGNTSDKKSFPETIASFTNQLKHNQIPCFIVDSALYTEANVQSLEHVYWLTRVPETVGLAHALVREISDDEFEATSNDEYQICEVSREYGGIMQRWFVVQSKQAREREWARAVEKIEGARKKEQKEFEALRREVFGCQKDAAIALKKITKKWRYQKVEEEELEEVMKYAGKGRPKKGEKPLSVGWKITGKLVVNEEALRRERASVGRFILASNMPVDQLSAEQALENYKSQGSSIERGFRFLKDPMFFADGVYLQKPERIMALLMVMTLSLLVYSLAERELRSQLAVNNDTLPDQKGKPTQKLTMRRVFQMFEGVNVLQVSSAGKEQVLIDLSDDQKKIIRYLGEQVGKCYGFP